VVLRLHHGRTLVAQQTMLLGLEALLEALHANGRSGRGECLPFVVREQAATWLAAWPSEAARVGIELQHVTVPSIHSDREEAPPDRLPPAEETVCPA
jgi:hypothetical protein